ncbi:putative solute carrier family 22 member 31 isoform X3 [Dromaius novaehollandiae]|uniref:putative solute carrier family 22 member 31 isoform X3 n=1 Tax=Dromaius novaehollandiae TaxID=8790 RepID=UPI00311D49CC
MPGGAAMPGGRPRGRRAAGGWVPCAALALGWALAAALGAPPPHRCRPDAALLPPPLRRLAGAALLRAAVPRLRGGWSPCQLYRYRPGPGTGTGPGTGPGSGSGAARPNGTGPCTRGWHYALPAAGLRSNLVTQWDLVCASRWKVPLEQTTHLLGWTLGSVAAGLACDRLGRRPAFVASLVLAVPLGLSVALAVDYVMALVTRLLFGAALAGAFLSLYVAQLEALSEGSPQPRYHAVCEIFGTRVIWKNGGILGFTAFIGAGIRHCFTRNLAPHLPQFFYSYFVLVGTEAVACAFVCLTAERFGRRAVLLLCTVLTGISSLLLLALTQYLLDLIVLTLSVVGITASHAVAMLSIFFASEVLPTVVRGAGLGLIVGASFVGKAAAPITAIPNSRGFFLHHVVFASFAILAVLSIMLLPESQGCSLPQSLQDGEGQRRPPLFRRPPREDHLPLLASQRAACPPRDYSRLAASTKRVLGPPGAPRAT